MTEYEKGRRQGRLEGYEQCSIINLITVQRMYELPADDLYRLAREVDREHSRVIAKGEEYYKRLKASLLEEYGIRFGWRKEEERPKSVKAEVTPATIADLTDMKAQLMKAFGKVGTE